MTCNVTNATFNPTFYLAHPKTKCSLSVNFVTVYSKIAEKKIHNEVSNSKGQGQVGHDWLQFGCFFLISRFTNRISLNLVYWKCQSKIRWQCSWCNCESKGLLCTLLLFTATLSSALFVLIKNSFASLLIHGDLGTWDWGRGDLVPSFYNHVHIL